MDKKTYISDTLVGVLSERALTHKVYRTEDGKIVIEDISVLDIYERADVEIDRLTGTPLIPGKRIECYGNGEHEGFERCCGKCDYFRECYREDLEDEEDLKAYNEAWEEFKIDPKTYTMDEVLEEIGLTHEELKQFDLS